MFQCFFFIWFALIFRVFAQDQSGFVSIDCGAASDYKDLQTGINYTVDARFITTGVPYSVSSTYQTDTIPLLLQNLRSFPNGTRNCYKVDKLAKGKPYLIRATFVYGNYDGKGQAPQFDIYLGANFWDSINLISESPIVTKEIIHLTSSNFIYFCLVNTGKGVPLITGLELRSFENKTYDTTSGSLDLLYRSNINPSINKTIRFQDDVNDRIWFPVPLPNTVLLSTNQSIRNNEFHVPGIVMQTAATNQAANDSVEFYFPPVGGIPQKYYVYMHFAELVAVQPNDSRSFNIFLNGNHWYGPVSPEYLSTTSVYGTILNQNIRYNFKMNKTESSTLPPLINACEVFAVKQLLQAETVQQDVDAVLNIKSEYKLMIDWQGDPCSPQEYMWDGLNCSRNDHDPPRIVSLDLSSNGLIGELSRFISNLDMLQVLDLSNNSLTGSVPGFLTELKSLHTLVFRSSQQIFSSRAWLSIVIDNSIKVTFTTPSSSQSVTLDL